jgi:hypothetical protein
MEFSFSTWVVLKLNIQLDVSFSGGYLQRHTKDLTDEAQIVLPNWFSFVNFRFRKTKFFTQVSNYLNTSHNTHFSDFTQQTKTKLCGLSPKANYTDWATAALSAKLVPTFADRGGTLHSLKLVPPRTLTPYCRWNWEATLTSGGYRKLTKSMSLLLIWLVKLWHHTHTHNARAQKCQAVDGGATRFLN